MGKISIYKKDNGEFVFDGYVTPAGTWRKKLETSPGSINFRAVGSGQDLFEGAIHISEITDQNGDPYVDVAAFDTEMDGFFVKASSTGGGDLEYLEATYAYGVIINLASSTATLTRTGNLSLHVSLPVQSGFRACLLSDNGDVNYYLNPANWAQKADGTASKLDGTDGQVMIEVPKHYIRFYPQGTTFRVMTSTRALSGYTEVKKYYVGAYEAAVQRSVNKLCSVKNNTADYRGGNNTSAWDAAANSLLGEPATNISLTNFRTYARARKALSTEWNVLPYLLRNNLVWLYYIEYANLNSQAAVAAKDGSGYSAGGLGAGVTTANSTEWTNFNGSNPFIPCGASDALGTGSGEVSVTVTDFAGAGVNRSFMANRWRGIENPFGHVWEFTDGVLVDVKSVADGGTSIAYATGAPSLFSSASFASYARVGSIARVENWIRTMILGENGHLFPEATGGAGPGSTGFHSDYAYTSVTSSSIRAVLWGGRANTGALAGLVSATSDYSPSAANASFGARLCFIPAS